MGMGQGRSEGEKARAFWPSCGVMNGHGRLDLFTARINDLIENKMVVGSTKARGLACLLA